MTLTARVTTIETLVGIGEPDYSGDGGPAASASLNEPKGVCLDRDGNLFIADAENHVVRRVDRATGLITTVAGRLAAGPGASFAAAGQAAAEPPGEEEDPFAEPSSDKSKTYSQVTDVGGTVRYVTGGGIGLSRFEGDGGPATRASLNFPSAVAVDRAGNLYIADTMNHRVRKVDARTGEISTLAGTGQPRFHGDGGPAASAGLNDPVALAVDETTLYIADQGNNRVRALDLSSGTIRTIAGDGTAAYNGDEIPATQASVAGPGGLALGPGGTLFIADTFNGRIRAVALSTGKISTVVGDGGTYRYQGPQDPPSASLSRPAGIAVTVDGAILITDSDSHLIRRYDPATKAISRVAGNGVAQFSGDGGDALAGSLSYPFGVAVDATGSIVVADTFNHRIRIVRIATEG
ncbi:MAG: hypothetical protein KF814_16365 [Nitrospiraceae bacterium]|nr:hypothetical protein [Nitrospiraceae bacterium]